MTRGQPSNRTHCQRRGVSLSICHQKAHELVGSGDELRPDHPHALADQNGLKAATWWRLNQIAHSGLSSWALSRESLCLPRMWASQGSSHVGCIFKPRSSHSLGQENSKSRCRSVISVWSQKMSMAYASKSPSQSKSGSGWQTWQEEGRCDLNFFIPLQGCLRHDRTSGLSILVPCSCQAWIGIIQKFSCCGAMLCRLQILYGCTSDPQQAHGMKLWSSIKGYRDVIEQPHLPH
jgi:hypothetical protein